MNLRELNILYTKVPDFLKYENGRIEGMYMIFEDDSVSFFVEVLYKNNNMIGLFNYDIENKIIKGIKKNDYIKILDKIEKVNKKKTYYNFKKALEKEKDVNLIVEYEKYFINIDEDSIISKYDSESYINFTDIEYNVKSKTSVLYATSNISTSYTKIDINELEKNKIEDIHYLTNLELNIKYNDNLFCEYGNIINVKNCENYIEWIIEPIEATMLDRIYYNGMNFSNLTPIEVIKIMLNVSKDIKVADDGEEKSVPTIYKYITTLNNFEMDEDVIQIDEITISKDIENIDKEKIKENSSKYVYLSIYVKSDSISKAKDIAMQKIQNVINIIQLVEKNSYFYRLYNEKEEINYWNINKIFVDYKIGDNFYIFNIINQEQYVFGSNKELILKNYGKFDKNSDIVNYNDEIDIIVKDISSKNSNLSNSIFWLNKGIEEINIDINKCVLYLNIALEYCTSKEKGKSFFEENEEAEEIYNKIITYLDIEYGNNETAIKIKDKLNNTLTSASIKNRFECMLEKLGVKFTEHQFKVYNTIRDARNDIIHGRKKVELHKRDIIDFYMFLSKVMYKKIKEEIK